MFHRPHPIRSPAKSRPGRSGGACLAARLALLLALLGTAVPAAWAQAAGEHAEVGRLVRAGQYDQALQRVDRYLASQPRDPQMRFLRGVIQTESGQTTEAIATFLQLTQEHPELPEPYNNLAVIYASQSEFDKARAALEMAIRTHPGYAIAYENLGDVYAKLASQSYAKAQQLDAGNPRVAPKLNLIRGLFPAPGARPSAGS